MTKTSSIPLGKTSPFRPPEPAAPLGDAPRGGTREEGLGGRAGPCLRRCASGRPRGVSAERPRRDVSKSCRLVLVEEGG